MLVLHTHLTYSYSGLLGGDPDAYGYYIFYVIYLMLILKLYVCKHVASLIKCSGEIASYSKNFYVHY